MSHPDSISIRPADFPPDQSAVLGLYAQTAEWHAHTWPDDLRVPDMSGLAEQVQTLPGVGDDNALLVAEVDGAVVGLVTGSIRQPPSDGMNSYSGPICWVGDVVVDPSHRHQGLGQRLMQSIESWARERGASTVELMVHTGNAAAESLYRREGYRAVHVQMRKDL